MKQLYCLLLSVCVSVASPAQSNVDSLFLKANRFYELHEYDSSIHYFNEMLQKSSDKSTRASALNGIGVAFSAKGLPDRSIPYYNQAISLYKELNDTTTEITISNNLAIIYKDKGLYENALDISFDVVQKLEKQKPDRTLASAYNTIGTVYARIQDYDKAYSFYRKSLTVRRAIGYEQGVGQSFGNIGELFIQMKKYDSALVNLLRSVKIREKIGDNRGLGRMLGLIGSTLIQSGRASEAIEQLTTAISLAQRSDDRIGEILALQETGAAYIALKEFKKAERALASSLSLIGKTRTNDYLKKNLELQSVLYRNNGDKDRLIETLDRLTVVKDSILNQQKIESLLMLEVQYETEKKEQEIILLQQQRKVDMAELEKNRQRIIFLIVVAAAFVIAAALGYRLYFVTQREKKASELHNAETHHRTKNNLQMLSAFFTIQASLLENDKKAQELVIDTQGRVKTMALIHNKLYQNLDAAEIDLREYITELVQSLVYTYGTSNIILDLQLYEERVDVYKGVKIGLLINELVTNALKYAYKDQDEPKLKVHLLPHDESLLLEVADNGKKPLSQEDFVNSKSFGLKMVKSLARELGGKIDLDNGKGTSFSLQIKIR